MRAAVGLTSVVHGVRYFTSETTLTFAVCATGGIEVLAGLLMLIGFFTPIAGALMSVVTIAAASALLPLPSVNILASALPAALLTVIALAVVLLGPGAISIDASLFGRREIIIPTGPRQGRN